MEYFQQYIERNFLDVFDIDLIKLEHLVRIKSASLHRDTITDSDFSNVSGLNSRL